MSTSGRAAHPLAAAARHRSPGGARLRRLPDEMLGRARVRAITAEAGDDLSATGEVWLRRSNRYAATSDQRSLFSS